MSSRRKVLGLRYSLSTLEARIYCPLPPEANSSSDCSQWEPRLGKNQLNVGANCEGVCFSTFSLISQQIIDES